MYGPVRTVVWQGSAGDCRPYADHLFAVLSTHAAWFTQKFGAASPEHYLFPFGKPYPTDATRPTTTMKTVWASIRKEAKVNIRLHDLRHTAATKMSEAGVPESTMLALMRHMGRAMLERYSHIRMAAKREAMKSLNAERGKGTKTGTKETTTNGKGAKSDTPRKATPIQ